ncbi:L,D-transpeptidase catalytic domain [Salinimicrobium catena]|uniref:L,D-transpeptidase catalytic domain n=1 Tax=Salinimicrobium catena TaxID=390640 RepID=A0A1H5PCM1_9FLAO|nr:murein L,D-transpeptidase catalytic domain family protein [Salinimicrobium catena]SDL79312.1 L,D-transpeptidase catalytic domain [Salinimicrobium catena]SEF11672.1 L,D-transpeptidase catalytic domain [Salinimicrobium catena]
MINKFLILATFLTASFAFTPNTSEKNTTSEPAEAKTAVADPALSAEDEINLLYEAFSAENASLPSRTAFTNGILGYQKLEEEGKIKKELLTIVDFGLNSTEKRMWILDMKSQKVLYNTYVSHGKNTGGDKATNFSNTPNSFQSSLGFYVTAETYYGKNGLSLFIDGMEEGFNSNARERYVVVHGADYATQDFIDRAGRLGRSYGCPAVPTKVSKEIINKIKGQSVLFIYHPNKNYLENSKYLNSGVAA